MIVRNDRPHEAQGDRPPAKAWRPSPREYPAKIEPPAYPGHHLVRLVSNAGTFRFNVRQIFLSNALAQEYIGLEETDDGIWGIYFYDVRLGTLDERDYRSTREMTRTEGEKCYRCSRSELLPIIPVAQLRTRHCVGRPRLKDDDRGRDELLRGTAADRVRGGIERPAAHTNSLQNAHDARGGRKPIRGEPQSDLPMRGDEQRAAKGMPAVGICGEDAGRPNERIRNPAPWETLLIEDGVATADRHEIGRRILDRHRARLTNLERRPIDFDLGAGSGEKRRRDEE